MNESTSPLRTSSAYPNASTISPAPIEISGAHATARVFASELESSAQGQIRSLCDQPFTAGSRIRVNGSCLSLNSTGFNIAFLGLNRLDAACCERTNQQRQKDSDQSQFGKLHVFSSIMYPSIKDSVYL
jgi:hypothetical protein